MLSPKLEQFKWKRGNVANFRCPLCGDSTKNKRKARGYLFERQGVMLYKCWNCSASISFKKLLDTLAPELSMEYARENFSEKHAGFLPTAFTYTPGPALFKKVEEKELKYCSRVRQLSDSHDARVYLEGRSIPSSHYGNLYYTDNLALFVKTNIDPHQENLPCDGAIIIIIRDVNGDIVGCNARNLNRLAKVKYIKAKVSPDVTLVYGIESVKKDSKVYVFEGEFNSMFIPNSVAVGGVAVMNGVENLLGVNKEQVIQVVDNDPRNPHVVKALTMLVEGGYNVVILPESIVHSDVNDLICKDKLQTNEIKKLLDDNTYCGLSAKLRLTEWRKC